MPLQSKAEYNDLSGEDGFEVLHTRAYDILKQIPELQRRFALTRVVMRIEVSLDIWGATPPKKIYQFAHEVTAQNLPPGFEGGEPVVASYVKSAVIDARDNPPDQIREQHGLPVPRAVRGQAGFMETRPVLADDEPEFKPAPLPTPTAVPLAQLPAQQANPNVRQIGKRVYAGWVEQDYGSLQAGERAGNEAPVIGAEKIADAASAGGSNPAPPQPDFRTADYRRMDPGKVAQVVARTVERGGEVDRTLADNERVPWHEPDPDGDGDGGGLPI